MLLAGCLVDLRDFLTRLYAFGEALESSAEMLFRNLVVQETQDEVARCLVVSALQMTAAANLEHGPKHETWARWGSQPEILSCTVQGGEPYLGIQ